MEKVKGRAFGCWRLELGGKRAEGPKHETA